MSAPRIRPKGSRGTLPRRRSRRADLNNADHHTPSSPCHSYESIALYSGGRDHRDGAVEYHREEMAKLGLCSNTSSRSCKDTPKLDHYNKIAYHVCLQEACEGEDLCVLLSVALQLEKEIRGPILDYQMPKLVVDLPNGGGKRLTSTSESYTGGAAVHAAPGLSGMKGWKKLMTAIQKPDKSMPMLGRRHCATGCGMTGVTCLMGIESYPLFVRLLLRIIVQHPFSRSATHSTTIFT
ncbi:hypothetical protein HBH51_218240 [Parastagonospora nodorum]|nr:hypothetical protein HBH51_218240 [Parastagonospora nodorum]